MNGRCLKVLFLILVLVMSLSVASAQQDKPMGKACKDNGECDPEPLSPGFPSS